MEPITKQQQERQHLRQQLRAQRRALNATEQQHHAQLLVRQLMKVPQFMRAQYFALYMANDGEIDPWPVAEQLWKMKRKTYLPVLRPDKQGELVLRPGWPSITWSCCLRSPRRMWFVFT